MKRALTAAALATLMALTVAPAFAAETHSHAGHAGAAGLELSLDQGRKWATDEALRRGMGEIRSSLAAALPAIHHGRLAPAEYDRLAAGIETQIDYVTTNCKLAPAADEQLHVVLGEILDGVGEMQGGADRQAGAVRVAKALDAYGAHFDHEGWEALAH